MLLFFFFFFSETQSKKSYEQRCKEADEAEQTAERLGAAPSATPKQIEKVNVFDGFTHKRAATCSFLKLTLVQVYLSLKKGKKIIKCQFGMSDSN